jgi:hypothetical protein
VTKKSIFASLNNAIIFLIWGSPKQQQGQQIITRDEPSLDMGKCNTCGSPTSRIPMLCKDKMVVQSELMLKTKTDGLFFFFVFRFRAGRTKKNTTHVGKFVAFVETH